MNGGAPDGVSIHVATPADRVAVSRVLDGALLECPDLPDRLADGTVLLARTDRAVVGAIVLDPAGPTDRTPPDPWPAAMHVEAIAVRRKRRNQGIGSALLRAALRRWAPLTADYDEQVKPFYESVGAACREADTDGRQWALLRGRSEGVGDK
ncbi:hypothetical protein GCM10028857_02720 [Salinarchaeum chitinilyticum]